jgi:putative cell wall-binding protein
LRSATIKKIEEKLIHNKNLNNLILNGSHSNLRKEQITQSSREEILELHNKTDYHQELLHDIKHDVIDTRTNLKGMAFQVKQDTETLNRVQNCLQDSGRIVKRTDKNITQMHRREFCHKLLLHTLALLFFISIVISIVYK